MSRQSVRQEHGFAIVPHFVTALVGTALTPHDLTVYVLLAKHADGSTREAKTSMRRLSQESGISTSTVRAAIGRLEEAGCIEVERSEERDQTGRLAVNGYVLPRDRIDTSPVAAIATGEPVPVAAIATGPVAIIATPPVAGAATYQEPPFSQEPIQEPIQAPAVQSARPRNPLWDAMAAVFGEPSNERLRGRRAKAVALMRESGVAPEEVDTLARVYRWKSRGAWPDTDIGLAGRIDDCRRWAAEGEHGTAKSLAVAVDRQLEKESLRRAFERAKAAGPGETRTRQRSNQPVDWLDLAAGGES